jgi:hypothetical protein
MEYNPWAKINKSPKEKQALVDAPVPSYNKEAVDKEIKRSRQKIGGSEAKKIHALLSGRHAEGGKIDLKHCVVNTAEKRNPKHKRF